MMEVLRSKTWIDIPDGISISELMNKNAFSTRDDKIIYEEALSGKTKTYRQFHSDVSRGAYWLRHSLGLTPGQRVAIVGPSCIDYICAVHAVWWAGGVVCPVNYSLHENEIATAFDLIQPEYVIFHDDIRQRISTILELCKTSHPLSILTMGTPRDGWVSFSDNASKETAHLDPFGLSGHDTSKVLAAILLSSGTTGKPKGVMLSHYNLVSAIHQLQADNPDNWRSDQKDIFFPPLSHVYALYTCITGSFWLGSYVCLMPRFHLETFCRLVQDRKATLARLVPPVAKELAEHPAVEKYDMTSLEYFSCSAAPLNSELAEKLRKRFPGVALCQTYGCTELSGPCIQSGVRDVDLPITATGTLIANMEMTFVNIDENGQMEQSGKGPGEITIKGPNVMMGYKDDPVATADSMLPGGWYRTGDLGYIDEQGYLVVYDRLKDIIKYNGFQVSPLELEEILVQHHFVDEVAVCGVWSHKDATEVVRAYVVPKPDLMATMDHGKMATELSRHVSERVARYKHLRGGVVFLDQLPKNPTGKVLRRVLRERAKEENSGKILAKL